jgi:catechol 2,3-dioxygenase-like lactoylglutathione lyase family enzyme
MKRTTFGGVTYTLRGACALCALILLGGCARTGWSHDADGTVVQNQSHVPSGSADPTGASKSSGNSAPTPNTGARAMQLGNFSVSLAVKDIAASRAFYEKLGFKIVGGDQTKNWVVLQNQTTTIGLFQGMFPKNMLTFNPGWDSNKASLPEFTDVREIQRSLIAQGLTPTPPIPAKDENAGCPTYFMLTDPDGNPILIDQHVPSPATSPKK